MDFLSRGSGSARKLAGGLSVFFPAYNDANSIASLVERTFALLPSVADDYEVIVVNDGSVDETAQVLEDLQAHYPLLRVVTHSENQGYGAALRSGLSAATKEFIFYTDGDGQYDPSELPILVERMSSGTSLVNGYKLARHDPWHRICIGWLYNVFARWIFAIGLRDIDCDFRLIRRSALRLSELQAKGGTICIEIVRQLESNGMEVAEVGVHHYARRFGRSQFFRVRSLLGTFGEICGLFMQSVVWRSLESAPSIRGGLVLAAVLAALVLVSYGWALKLPFIGDDYVQIALARQYGAMENWGVLAQDALYRCRATSLVLTYWVDHFFGLAPGPYNAIGLMLHWINTLAVFALGRWQTIGWRVSTLAACSFAIGQRKSEAIVWFSAVPELLVFFFCLASFLCFLTWLQKGGWWYSASFCGFLLALLSKESAVAVVPLIALLLVTERARHKYWSVLPFVVTSVCYFLLAYENRGEHLHFNDGTFSLDAPFARTLFNSSLHLLRVWGSLGLLMFLNRKSKPYRVLLVVSAFWIVVTLLPYSFLTYMGEVPSRHTYLASVGRSFLLAAGALILLRTQKATGWLTPTCAAVFLLHQTGYLWLVKQPQYVNRARPTELLLEKAVASAGPVYAKCFPYSPWVATYALQVAGLTNTNLQIGPEAANHPKAVDFCNDDAHQ